MRKVFKFVLAAAGIVAGILVLLLAAAAVIIPLKFPPSKLKAMATDKLSATLHHKVTIGDVHFNVLSGFDIKDLRIANRAGWAVQPILSAKDISISYHLWPLLWGQVSLGTVQLNQPVILVERRGLENFNFSNMMGGTPAAPAAKPAKEKKGKSKPKRRKRAALPLPVEGPAFSSFFADTAWADTAPPAAKPSKTALLLSVDSVNIVHGRMVYLDETVSPVKRYDLADLNFHVKNISMVGGLSSFSMSTPFGYDRLKYQLSMKGSYRYFLAGQSLKDLVLEGMVNDLGFKLSGDALDMASDFRPDMDGEASLDMLKFSGLVPASLSRMPAGLSLTGPADVSFHLGGSAQKGLELSGTANGTALSIRYKDLFVKSDKTTCKVVFKSFNNIDRGVYDVPSFKVDYGPWQVTGDFHYRKGSPWSCHVRSKSLPFKGLSDMIPKLKGTTVDGGGSLDLSIAQVSHRNLPFTMNGQVALKGVGITLPKGESYLQSMNGTVYCSSNVVRVPAITFKGFDGTGAMGVTFNGNDYAYTYGLRLSKVNAQKAIDASIDAYVTTKDLTAYKDKLYGTLNLAYAGSGRGVSGPSMIASQVGRGSYNLVNTRFKGLAAIKTLNGFFKDKSDEIRFEKTDGVLSMRNKVFSYTADNEGKVGAVTVTGGINVADMVYSPDMKIRADIKKEFIDSQELMSNIPAQFRGLVKDLSYLGDDKGNIPVDFIYTGPVSANRFRWDSTRLLDNVKRRAAKDAEKAAGNLIRNGGKDLGKTLKGLFGR